MTNLILAVVSLIPGAMRIETGILSQYGKQPTDGTLAYRQEMGQVPYDLPDNIVLLAVADCDHIGREGLISINDGEFEPMLVFDCAGSTRAYNWLVDNNFLGEIDFYSAERHGVVCRCPVPGEIVWLD